MESTIKKWGNSLGIRIPNVFAKEMDLRDGSSVEVEKEGERIIIKPSRSKNLSDKLKRINSNNLHNEIISGNQIGNEFW